MKENYMLGQIETIQKQLLLLQQQQQEEEEFTTTTTTTTTVVLKVQLFSYHSALPVLLSEDVTNGLLDTFLLLSNSSSTTTSSNSTTTNLITQQQVVIQFDFVHDNSNWERLLSKVCSCYSTTTTIQMIGYSNLTVLKQLQKMIGVL